MSLIENFALLLANDSAREVAVVTVRNLSCLQLVIESEGHSNSHATIELINEKCRKFRLQVKADRFYIDQDTFAIEQRRVAVADYILRNFCASLASLSSSTCYIPIIPPTIDQKILQRNYIDVSRIDGSVSVEFRVLEVSAENARQFFLRQLPSLVSHWISCSNTKCSRSVAHWQSSEDQNALRELVSRVGVSFVADGSLLPRAGGNDDRPLSSDSVVPFESPVSFRTDFILPHRGRISGMLVPKGVTVITGGGYHGKSTILNAIKMGMYNKIPGDGREFVVTELSCAAIRSEDGRYVSGVDISPFIDNLPPAAKIDPSFFSTNSSSGSTSMAANVIESMELDPKLFLLDEDTCASNFMVRDSRMRSMIANEPITPFIYRVNSLYKEKGISSIVVIGGSGDWFDVQDTTIMMDNYACIDASKKARSICKTFCTGRVQFNGRGLVHQLPWPQPKSSKINENESQKDRISLPTGNENALKSVTDRSTRRVLLDIVLPFAFLEGGSVYASADGNSVTFSSPQNDHAEHILPGNKRKAQVSVDDLSDLHSPSSSSDGHNSTVIRSKNVDLSKLEQRIVSREGSIGIAFAVIFVKAVLKGGAAQHLVPTGSSREVGDENEREHTNNCGRTAYVRPSHVQSCDALLPSDDQLSTLLARFDRLRSCWRDVAAVSRPNGDTHSDADSIACEGEKVMSDIGPSNGCLETLTVSPSNALCETQSPQQHHHLQQQLNADLDIARRIHTHLLDGQDFIWPRLTEAAASINRLRGATFTTEEV